MIIRDYKQIDYNLKQMNNVMLVLKDNAYGFDIFKITKLAMDNNINWFCVNNLDEARDIKSIYQESFILILGRVLCNDSSYIYSISTLDDYTYMKQHKLYFHYCLNIGMNRFGFDNIYNEVINDDLCLGIYFHSNLSDVFCDLEKFRTLTSNFNKMKHIGGSVYLNNSDYIVRVGKSIYDNSFYLYGSVIFLRNVKCGERIGYNATYLCTSDCIVAICDLGYCNGLVKDSCDIVFINNKRYKTIGLKCMDYCFILVDKDVSLFDKVEFIGKNIKIEEFCSNNNISIYEAYLRLK